MRRNARVFNRTPSPARPEAFSFTLHSAVKANMLGAFQNRGFVVMAAIATVSRAAVVCLAMTSLGARAAEAEPHAAPAKPICLNAADTRDQVKAHKLLEPYAALKFAAQQRKAEALSAKLCVSGDDFIYVITLLHRDGQLIHVQMEAGTGKLIARPGHEAHEPKDAHDAHDAREQPVKN
jgi:uncharacterized membrane protein YkoI